MALPPLAGIPWMMLMIYRTCYRSIEPSRFFMVLVKKVEQLMIYLGDYRTEERSGYPRVVFEQMRRRQPGVADAVVL